MKTGKKQDGQAEIEAYRLRLSRRGVAGGSARTPRKAAAARRNGSKGGQPLSDRRCSICKKKRLGVANRSGVCKRCVPALRKSLRALGRVIQIS